jgi:hypothetical protein
MNDTALPDNPRAVVGDNRMPRPGIEAAQSGFRILSNWLAQNPVIETHETAVAAKTRIDDAKAVLDGMETSRDAQVRPLNEQVREINADYKAVREPLEKLLHEIKNRLQRFMLEEERRRLEEAERARLAREEAEKRARDAEAAEREAIDNAAAGEFVDVGAATMQADEAFSDFKSADRQARVAERDAKVRIGGGEGRALTMRSAETITIEDPVKAIKALLKERAGLPEKIEAAIISAARDYRKLKGRLPDGVTSTKERTI